jgi:SAM-dependent methyltransferase
MPLDVRNIWNACGEAFDRYTTADDSFSDNIERPVIESLIGELTGNRVLDLGCGSGAYSLWFAGRGASVVGLDLSETMISIAQERSRGIDADFRVSDIRDALPFNDHEFDLVFSATALHYVDNLTTTMTEVARVLKPAGLFLASVLHPMSTALFPLADSEIVEGPDPWEGWYFGSPVRCIETPWLGFGDISNEGRRIFCHHHTIADYVSSLTSAGMTITQILEPSPSADFAVKNPSRYDEAMRVPIYLILMARRGQATEKRSEFRV